MNQENNSQKQTTENTSNRVSSKNPFENNQSVEKDISESKEATEKEQEFKEAQTERD